MSTIPPDIYEHVGELAADITNATLADDHALAESLYQRAFIVTTRSSLRLVAVILSSSRHWLITLMTQHRRFTTMGRRLRCHGT